MSLFRHAVSCSLIAYAWCDTSTSDCPGSLLTVARWAQPAFGLLQLRAVASAGRSVETALQAADQADGATCTSSWVHSQQGYSTWCGLSHPWGSAATAWSGHHGCAALWLGVTAIPSTWPCLQAIVPITEIAQGNHDHQWQLTDLHNSDKVVGSVKVTADYKWLRDTKDEGSYEHASQVVINKRRMRQFLVSHGGEASQCKVCAPMSCLTVVQAIS